MDYSDRVTGDAYKRLYTVYKTERLATDRLLKQCLRQGYIVIGDTVANLYTNNVLDSEGETRRVSIFCNLTTPYHLDDAGKNGIDYLSRVKPRL